MRLERRGYSFGAKIPPPEEYSDKQIWAFLQAFEKSGLGTEWERDNILEITDELEDKDRSRIIFMIEKYGHRIGDSGVVSTGDVGTLPITTRDMDNA